MLENLFAPLDGVGELVLRVGLGIVFIPHGWMKLDPNGPTKGPAGFGAFLKQMGVPLPVAAAWLVALLETAGAVLLILGAGTRVLALAFAFEMLVAITLAKIRMMKATFLPRDGGPAWELDFTLLAGALALAFTGAGRFALDPLLGL